MSEPRLGIDLGGTKIEALIIDANGHEQMRMRRPTPQDDYDQALSSIAELCLDIERACGIDKPLALGIGTPGTVSKKTGLMKNCNSTCINGRALESDLCKLTGRAVRVANDANCFTLSEATDGSGAGFDVVFGVILGTGVGGGISAHQRLLPGVNGIGGEWGHAPLPLNVFQEHLPLATGRDCYCGRRDCIEIWLSGPSFERNYLEIKTAELTGQPLAAPAIVEAARQGDQHAKACLDLYIQLLAMALATVINIVDPDAIVLGGGMSNINELIPGLNKALPAYVFSDRVDTELVTAMHGDSSGVRGAAWLWNEVGNA